MVSLLSWSWFCFLSTHREKYTPSSTLDLETFEEHYHAWPQASWGNLPPFFTHAPSDSIFRPFEFFASSIETWIYTTWQRNCPDIISADTKTVAFLVPRDYKKLHFHANSNLKAPITSNLQWIFINICTVFSIMQWDFKIHFYSPVGSRARNLRTSPPEWTRFMRTVLNCLDVCHVWVEKCKWTCC